MRPLALLCAAALAAPAAAQETLPPPPPPPGYEPAPAPPPPPPDGGDAGRTSSAGPRSYTPARRPGTIGDGPIAPAGSQAAPLHPDESFAHWRFALATGVTGKFGGRQIQSGQENPGVLLYLGGQADGLWTEGWGRAARLRFRMFTGGESEIFFPSDGDIEAAYMIGRPEFRFVLGRAEVGRYPALALQLIAQAATLPSFEGSIPLAGDTMRVYYYLSPVEAAYVRYYGGAHIVKTDPAASETDSPVASSAGRLRFTALLPPSMLLSLQGDVMKMWQKEDLLMSGEGSLGYQAFEQTAVFNISARWNSYTRRGKAPTTTESESEFLLSAAATLVF